MRAEDVFVHELTVAWVTPRAAMRARSWAENAAFASVSRMAMRPPPEGPYPLVLSTPVLPG